MILRLGLGSPKIANVDDLVLRDQRPVEPVEPGTNLAAASCPDVDVLAHPGLLTAEEALQWGLVSHLVPKGQSMAKAREIAKTASIPVAKAYQLACDANPDLARAAHNGSN